MNNVSTPPSGGEVVGVTILGIFFWIVLIVCYFGPTIIAALRKHRQLAAIAAVNLLLGWTVIGWIGSFIWSLITPAPSPQPQTIIIQQPGQPPSQTPPA
jgi:hypothetical protein